jgi:hypothetical protein
MKNMETKSMLAALKPVTVNVEHLGEEFDRLHASWSDDQFETFGHAGFGLPELPVVDCFRDATVLICTESQLAEIIENGVDDLGTAVGPWGEHNVSLQEDVDEIFVYDPNGESYLITEGISPEFSEYDISDDVRKEIEEAAKAGDLESVCQILEKESWRGGIKMSTTEMSDGKKAVLSGFTHTEILDMFVGVPEECGWETEPAAALVMSYEMYDAKDRYDCGTDSVPAIIVRKDGSIETIPLADESLSFSAFGPTVSYCNYHVVE